MNLKIDLGSTPAFEPSVPINSENYQILARKECQRYVDLLRAMFGKEPEGAKLIITENKHEQSRCLEVCVQYDPSEEKAINYAFKLESEAPTNWENT